MLKLFIEPEEFFNQETQEFQDVLEGFELELEHSLVSLSKWEAQTEKPFLSQETKTPNEILLYVEAMVVSPRDPKHLSARLTQEHIDKIKAYIGSSQSATTFGNMPQRRGPGQTITSELIYFWMVTFNIPFECERWHLNRLFSLIRICNDKNTKPKKMSKGELAAKYRKLNAERKEKMGTSG